MRTRASEITLSLRSRMPSSLRWRRLAIPQPALGQRGELKTPDVVNLFAVQKWVSSIENESSGDSLPPITPYSPSVPAFFSPYQKDWQRIGGTFGRARMRDGDILLSGGSCARLQHEKADGRDWRLGVLSEAHSGCFNLIQVKPAIQPFQTVTRRTIPCTSPKFAIRPGHFKSAAAGTFGRFSIFARDTNPKRIRLHIHVGEITAAPAPPRNSTHATSVVKLVVRGMAKLSRYLQYTGAAPIGPSNIGPLEEVAVLICKADAAEFRAACTHCAGAANWPSVVTFDKLDRST
ncbi:hypothetical protein EVAR_5387_1 [Eumeta japonica]|uniref:Uncharacterized protein n=1 Tax=Eumeta variegata TaxID=151549 RepID=A0A4C1TP00_EUMVA|nr:hypothetical protein EVAR_5387_1 [Eumeta japonica]